MDQPSDLTARTAYEIRVLGAIDAGWLAGFGALEMRPAGGTECDSPATLLTVVTDQAGLVGLIRRLHGMAVVLVSIRHAPDGKTAQR